MSFRSRKAWLVAASIGAVEALKDQGFCRWDYAIRVAQQHAKTINLRSYVSQAKKLSIVSNNMIRREDQRSQEESLRTVMYLSCWGPN